MIVTSWILLLILPVLMLDPATADDRDFLDDDIPSDWRDYVPKDMVNKVWNVADRSTGLFQGDIAGIDSQAIRPGDTFSNALTDEQLLWPNRLVPYEMSPVLRANVKDFVLKAFADIESKTCIRFIPRKYEEDYLKIVAGFDCWSYVGRQGNEQVLSMNRGCQDGLGATEHEVMHALGIIHEQARPDRDKYVWINKKNIPTDNNTQTQFAAYGKSEVTDLGTPYDYESVMHYGWNAFAKNKNYPTVLPKEKGKRIGQREKLSPIDVQRLNLLYKCNEVTTEKEVTRDYSATWTNWFGLCDGKNDTPEGWDENPDVCLKMCDKIDQEQYGGKVLFNLPNTKRCMHKSYLCDGIKDSDADVSEEKEICQKYCKGGGFVALAPSYQCVQFRSLCDGNVDTVDGSDEIKDNCLSYCHSPDLQEFKDQLFNLEPIGRCMMKRWLCDGIADSATDTTEDPEVCAQYCTGGGFFLTKDIGQCIHYTSLCNGRKDTQSGEDEVKSYCIEQCPEIRGFIGDLFNQPGTGHCLHKRSLCSGIKESAEAQRDDPAFCEDQCTGDLYFPTEDTKQCIKATDLCDGKNDARNGWDEISKNCVRFCKLMNKRKNLVINPRTKRCSKI